jgi:hypothetical protein
MEPKALVIEARQLGEGIKAVIMIEADQGTPGFEPTAQGSQGSAEPGHDLREGENLPAPPEAEQGGESLGGGIHMGTASQVVAGTVYAIGI